MRNTDYFSGKIITIVGLARSGGACAHLLHFLGAHVRISDRQNTPEIRERAMNLAHLGIGTELGRHTREMITASDMLVVSPGVSVTSDPVMWALEAGIPVISEIEVGWLVCEAPVVAVTGSSGKTTTTTLIADVVRSFGRKVYVCGNIGTPFTGEVAKVQAEDLVVLEVSSFQLERVFEFKPKIAVMLNLSRNHLDRHADMQEYLEAKKRIFQRQDDNDYLVLNEEDPSIRACAKESRARVRYFRSSAMYNQNQAAVVTVASILGIPEDSCRKVFENFRGLPHRMELVAEVRGVRFINDSKATVAESTAWALRSINKGVVLIAGGRDKGVDYGLIREAGHGKVRAVIAIGEAKELIKKALQDAFPVDFAATMEEAVRKGLTAATQGDSVLLSPMCSSFDMFRDYEDRGQAFKDAVAALSRETSP